MNRPSLRLPAWALALIPFVLVTAAITFYHACQQGGCARDIPPILDLLRRPLGHWLAPEQPVPVTLAVAATPPLHSAPKAVPPRIAGGAPIQAKAVPAPEIAIADPASAGGEAMTQPAANRPFAHTRAQTPIEGEQVPELGLSIDAATLEALLRHEARPAILVAEIERCPSPNPRPPAALVWSQAGFAPLGQDDADHYGPRAFPLTPPAHMRGQLQVGTPYCVQGDPTYRLYFAHRHEHAFMRQQWRVAREAGLDPTALPTDRPLRMHAVLHLAQPSGEPRLDALRLY